MSKLSINGVGRGIPKLIDKNLESNIKRTDAILENLKNFPVRPDKYAVIDARNLKNFFLEQDKIFNTLKKEIETFNNMIRKCAATDTEIPNYEWKHTLFVGLRNLLTEVVTTEDRQLQNKFLNKANEWFYNQIIKKEGPIKDKVDEKLKTIIPKSIDENLLKNRESLKSSTYLMASNPDFLLPSEYSEATLKDYQEGARTKHNILEPPYERIQEYERKFPNEILRPNSQAKNTGSDKNLKPLPQKVQPVVQNRVSVQDYGIATEEGEGEDVEEDQPKPVVEQKQFKINIPLRRLFANDSQTKQDKIILDQLIPIENRSNYAYYAPSGEIAELSLEQRWRDNQNKKLMEKREHEEVVNLMKEWSFVKSRVDEESVRKNESMIYGSNFESRAFKPRVKSAMARTKEYFSPVVKKNLSRSASKQPNGYNEGNELETKELEEALDYESDEEFEEAPSHYINISKIDPKSIVWEDRRPKTCDPSVPRIIDYSSTSQPAMTTQFTSQKSENLIEDEMIRQKIEKIRKMNSHIFSHGMKPMQDNFVTSESPVARKSTQMPSLSVYDEAYKIERPFRPFSAVYSKINDTTIRKEQIDEIMDVKKKLAKFKINVPTKTIAAALLPPDKALESQLKPLPLPGSRLLKNPFIKEKKKKKKKKKKKTTKT